MRGLKLGSKPAEWSTSTTTTQNVVTNFQTTTSWNTSVSTVYAGTTGVSTTKSTTTSWTTSRSTTTSWTTSQSTTTSWTTSRSTTRSTTTTWATSRSTTTSWTTSRSTTTTFNTARGTTRSTTTTWSTSRSTTTSWTTSRSTTTTFNTSRSTTTSYTTTWSTSKSTTTTFSTSKSTTTSWTTSRSTTTTFNTSSNTTTTYTTSWTTSTSTFQYSRGTYKFSSTSWQTTWISGLLICVVENQLVHYNTYQATDISQFGSGSTILEMDTPFDTDDRDELFEITSSTIDNGGGLLTGSVVENMIYSASGGIININKYDLLITGDHPQPIFRSGSWTVERGDRIEIGDGLYHISGSQPTGSIIWVWDLEVDTTGSYKVFNISSEPHDVYFVNGFLTHNK